VYDFDPWEHRALTEALAAEAAAAAIEGRAPFLRSLLDPLDPALRREVEAKARRVIESLTDIPAELQREALPAIVGALRHGGDPMSAAVEALAVP